MPTDKTPTLLSPAQRAQFVRIPDDLSDREIARFYTFSAPEFAVIKHHRRPANRLGFAVQLAVLRFPGRTLTDLPDIPVQVLDYIAGQVRVPPRGPGGLRTPRKHALRALGRDSRPLWLSQLGLARDARRDDGVAPDCYGERA